MLSFRSATGILVRGLHSAGAGGLQAPKSALAKLRKKTGYSLSLCKKALEQHEQDIVKAEEWLKVSRTSAQKICPWKKSSSHHGQHYQSELKTY